WSPTCRVRRRRHPRPLDATSRSRYRLRPTSHSGTPMLESITPLLSDPAAWAALVTLVVMEVVLGIDNLIFISILSNKLPPEHRQRTRRIGIGLALVMRLGLLAAIGWIVGLTAPVFDLGIHGESFDTAFSWRDLILIAGGLFLV